MVYNTKNIVRDASGAPIPQLFNPAADEYQPLEGTGGAHKTQLTGRNVANETETLEATLVKDDAGKGVLRVVDAAPFIVEISKYTTPAHTAVNVTSATNVVLAANANRKYALIINNSDEEIFLALGTAAVAARGILLLSKGSSYEISAMQGNLYLGAINGIHAGAGNKQVLATEGV